MTSINISEKKSVENRFREMPVLLQIFTFYVVLNSLAAFCLCIAPFSALSRTILPYTGVMGAGGYLFQMIPLFGYLFKGDRAMLRLSAYFLGIIVLWGIVDMGIHHWPGIKYSAPPHAYLREFFVIGIPLLWIVCLQTKEIKKWISARENIIRVLDGIHPSPNALQSELLIQQREYFREDPVEKLQSVGKLFRYACLVLGVIAVGALIGFCCSPVSFEGHSPANNRQLLHDVKEMQNPRAIQTPKAGNIPEYFSAHTLINIAVVVLFCVVLYFFSRGFSHGETAKNMGIQVGLLVVVMFLAILRSLLFFGSSGKPAVLTSLHYLTAPGNFFDILLLALVWMVGLCALLYFTATRFSRGIIFDRITISYLIPISYLLLIAPAVGIFLTGMKIAQLSALPHAMGGILLLHYTLIVLMLGQLLIGSAVLISCRIMEHARRMKEEAELTI